MPLTKRAIWLLTVGLVVGAALGGCGSGSEAAPLSRSAFVKEANAICSRMQTERSRSAKKVVSAASGAPEGKEVEAGTDALLAPVKKMTAEIGELVPMKSQARQVEELLNAFEKAVNQIESEPPSHRTPVAFDGADELARRYGLTECAI